MKRPIHTPAWTAPVVTYDDPAGDFGGDKRPLRITVHGNGAEIVHIDDLRQGGLSFKTRMANARIIGAGTTMIDALKAASMALRVASTQQEQQAALGLVNNAIFAALGYMP